MSFGEQQIGQKQLRHFRPQQLSGYYRQGLGLMKTEWAVIS
jgi:hypothetical protein